MKILYFTAVWCGPCRAFSPVWDKVKTDFPDIDFQKIDVDENPDLAAKYNVRAVPTVVAVVGENLRVKQGGMSEAKFRAFLKED